MTFCTTIKTLKFKLKKKKAKHKKKLNTLEKLNAKTSSKTELRARSYL